MSGIVGLAAHVAFLGGIAVLTGWIQACSSNGATNGTSCPVAREGCPCTPGGSCASGLTCLSKVCVLDDSSAKDGGGTPGTGGTPSGSGGSDPGSSGSGGSGIGGSSTGGCSNEGDPCDIAADGSRPGGKSVCNTDPVDGALVCDPCGFGSVGREDERCAAAYGVGFVCTDGVYCRAGAGGSTGAGGSAGAGGAGVITCTTVGDALNCTKGTLAEINLGQIGAGACHDQCQVSMVVAGMTSGCWILATNTNCYCRSGVLTPGGTVIGGTCN